MDPNIYICKYKLSFDKQEPIPELHSWLYQSPNTILKKFNTPGDDKYKGIDLFKDVSYKPFLNKDAITLANIDAVFNFTGQVGGYILKQDMKDYVFLVLDDAPGGYSQYLFYRNPASYGFGTYINTQYDRVIDPLRFNPIKRSDNYVFLVNNIKALYPAGTDVVISSSLLSLYNLATAINVLKIASTFVSKAILTPDLLYLASLCFDKVTLFVPVSDNNIYLVAEGRKINNTNMIILIDKLIRGITDKAPAPTPEFINWVNQYSTILSQYNQLVREYSDNKLLDTYKCKAIWNLPSL